MMLLTMGDRYIIKYYLNYSEVGIYSLGFKIAGVINMLVIQSFQTGFLPIAYKNFDKPDAQSFFSKTLSYYALVLVFMSLGLSLFAQEVIELFSKDQSYLIAYTVVPFISLAFIFKGIQYVYSLGLHFVKKTKYNAYIVFSAAVLNVGLNFLLIPHFKIYGAAVATIITWIAMSTVFYFVSYKFYKVKYEFLRIALMVVIGIALYCISLLFVDMNLYVRSGLKMILVFLFPVLLFLFRFFNKLEIQGLKGFWRKWKNPGQWVSNLKKG
jgi:O-antigen/teichoic acid export membrane protein